jgi:pimeloyl-ACP methyl ester carboxylesterase
MEVTSSDGTRIHYEVHGSGPTIVLAHGSLMEGASWIEAGYVASLEGFRCIVLDCRGYGASDRSHEPLAYEVERYVEDIVAVADEVGAARFGVAGFSWGTAGAWKVAASHPRRVGAFVAIGGWHPNLYSFDLEVMEKTRIEPMQQIGVQGFAEFMKVQEGPLPEWWERQVLACDPHAYIAQRYAAVNWTRTAPTAVTVPTLLVSGVTEDTARDSALIAGVMDKGEAVIVEGRGHCQNFLAPETIEATRGFSERHLA